VSFDRDHGGRTQLRGPAAVATRTIAPVESIPFVKGHGTRNDFVLLPDPDGLLDLTAELVAELCDRRGGIGADGVLRVVRSSAISEGTGMAHLAPWFMDYRNSDGTTSETCGNGLRVFARYLVDAGLAQPGRIPVATRGGVVAVWADVRGDITVDMGPAKIDATSSAVVHGRPFEGVMVSMANPHLVCVTDVDVDSLDLTTSPDVDPLAFPTGVNVEFVNRVGERHYVMRVHERGSGETQSCGSGACAVVAALVATEEGNAAAAAQDGTAAAAAQDGTAAAAAQGGTAAAPVEGSETDEYLVDLPGGRLAIRIDGDGHVLLRGPAVVVAEGRWRINGI
jgi:diaminopimelate epimerase